MRTKMAGYLMIMIAILTGIADFLNGGQFDLNQHFQQVIAALSGAGLIFLRSGVDKAKK